jgi:MtN3 and saliva related transmembrane protein
MLTLQEIKKEEDKANHKTNPKVILIIGIIAGILSSIAFLPQLVIVINNRIPSKLSFVTLTVAAIAQFLWIVYGYEVRDKPVYIFSSIAFVIYAFLFLSKFTF